MPVYFNGPLKRWRIVVRLLQNPIPNIKWGYSGKKETETIQLLNTSIRTHINILTGKVPTGNADI